MVREASRSEKIYSGTSAFHVAARRGATERIEGEDKGEEDDDDEDDRLYL